MSYSNPNHMASRRSLFASLCTILLLCVSLVAAQQAPGTGYKPIILDSTYQHTKWGIEPSDLIYTFAAYTTSFDSDDDNNGDGVGDLWGIPEWVAYEIKKQVGPETPDYDRPTWLTADSLSAIGKAPNDATYAISGTTSLKEVSTTARFVRGHMCPKDTADRISMFAGYNTHTILNAVPQLQWQNNGIWKALELECTKWADDHDQIWVICGPVFFDKNPAMWLGQKGEVLAAIPDALFKIVIRQVGSDLETLSFIIPNIIADKRTKFFEYLTSMARIESLTGLNFMTQLDPSMQQIIKARHDGLTRAKKRQAVNKW